MYVMIKGDNEVVMVEVLVIMTVTVSGVLWAYMRQPTLLQNASQSVHIQQSQRFCK